MTDISHKTALIVGASRGLGLALAEEYLKRGWRVIATQRGDSGLAALSEKADGRLEIENADIVVEGQIAALRDRLAGRALDLLFVNAGISNDPKELIGAISTAEFNRLMVTNVLGPMRVVEAFGDLVAGSGTIAVMSSGLGSIANNVGGSWEVYRASKAALNMAMRSFAARGNDPRSLLIVAPGWVRTDMGGPQAIFSIDESIPPLVDTIIAEGGKPGLRYLDRFGQTIPW